MSYSWFRVDSSVANNPKVLTFEAVIGDPNGLAYITRLHCWTHVHATSGSFSRLFEDQVEAACKWRGGRGKLIAAFIKVGLIDAKRRTLEVHDWPEYQGKLVDKSKRDAELKRLKRAAEKKDGAKTARAGRAATRTPAPAPTLPTDVTDGRDGRSLEPPDQKLRSDPPRPASNRLENKWGAVAERLVTWMRCQRSLAGNYPDDRESDLTAANAWALDWALKYEPDDRAYDVMCSAFNGFLENGPGDRALSLWCTENVWRQRWDTERAKAAA